MLAALHQALTNLKEILQNFKMTLSSKSLASENLSPAVTIIQKIAADHKIDLDKIMAKIKTQEKEEENKVVFFAYAIMYCLMMLQMELLKQPKPIPAEDKNHRKEIFALIESSQKALVEKFPALSPLGEIKPEEDQKPSLLENLGKLAAQLTDLLLQKQTLVNNFNKTQLPQITQLAFGTTLPIAANMPLAAVLNPKPTPGQKLAVDEETRTKNAASWIVTSYLSKPEHLSNLAEVYARNQNIHDAHTALTDTLFSGARNHTKLYLAEIRKEIATATEDKLCSHFQKAMSQITRNTEFTNFLTELHKIDQTIGSKQQEIRDVLAGKLSNEASKHPHVKAAQDLLKHTTFDTAPKLDRK